MVLLGPPASGKGTQGRRITEHYGVPVTSVGEVLRREKEAGTVLGLEAATYFDHGRLVPDRIAVASIAGWLEENKDAFVFDGFPRTVGQAEALDDVLSRHQAPLMVAIWLEVDAETIRDRVGLRVICADCGQTFRIGWQVQNRQDACPLCAGRLETRHDDDAETLVQRMAQYREHTEPLIAYYEGRGLLRRVHAGRSPEEVSREIETIFENIGGGAQISPAQPEEVVTR